MAQYTLDPSPTREELFHVGRLILQRKKDQGYSTNKQVAEVIGLQESELSRLLNARIDRKWGFARLSKIASWLGIDIDKMLRRPEGTTHVLVAGGTTPRPVPIMRADRVLVSKHELMRAATEISRERERLRALISQEVGPDKASKLIDLVEGYIDRASELRDSLVAS